MDCLRDRRIMPCIVFRNNMEKKHSCLSRTYRCLCICPLDASLSFNGPYGGTQVGSPDFGLTAQIENSSDSVPVMFDEYRFVSSIFCEAIRTRQLLPSEMHLPICSPFHEPVLIRSDVAPEITQLLSLSRWPACVKFDQVNQCKTSTDDEVGLQSVLRFLPFG
uniref:Uncharacterized protein n=1 Tax=Trichuris muris TaxID=70415 RepID=A0A5S6R2S4_TRIMR